jgi:GT2 family glycosyltransferase
MSDVPPGLVGVPAVAWMWTPAACAFMELGRALPKGSRIAFEASGCTLAAKRNRLVQKLLDRSDHEWLLFVDSDQTPPPDALERLWALGSPLASAVIVSRFGPGDTERKVMVTRMAKRGMPTDPLRPASSDPDIRYENATAASVARASRPFKADAAGCGCLLVRRAVFEALEAPWFAAQEDGCMEDTNFTLRATDAGFRLLVDPMLRVGHLGLKAWTVEDIEAHELRCGIEPPAAASCHAAV